MDQNKMFKLTIYLNPLGYIRVFGIPVSQHTSNLSENPFDIFEEKKYEDFSNTPTFEVDQMEDQEQEEENLYIVENIDQTMENFLTTLDQIQSLEELDKFISQQKNFQPLQYILKFDCRNIFKAIQILSKKLHVPPNIIVEYVLELLGKYIQEMLQTSYNNVVAIGFLTPSQLVKMALAIGQEDRLIHYIKFLSQFLPATDPFISESIQEFKKAGYNIDLQNFFNKEINPQSTKNVESLPSANINSPLTAPNSDNQINENLTQLPPIPNSIPNTPSTSTSNIASNTIPSKPFKLQEEKEEEKIQHLLSILKSQLRFIECFGLN